VKPKGTSVQVAILIPETPWPLRPGSCPAQVLSLARHVLPDQDFRVVRVHRATLDFHMLDDGFLPCDTRCVVNRMAT